LLGSSSLVSEAFTAAIGDGAAAQTYLTTPTLAPAEYPPSAQRVLAQYRKQFGGEPGAWALSGFEAMSVVLDAIRRAGARGNERQAVIDAFFSAGERDSVLGRYSIEADGEPTFAHYGVDRVSGGRAQFYRAIDVR
ncbi:MAG TPA: ABC transporter substrate-binding protein, partial [Solirubrobacteraceae bacterium]|nr:ABC transporter substrate-binding protein [Solirubrobacteraceae bacterium]